ncbi:MAG: Lrp/AsnC ligand binding domain-containing protein [archaeon]
MVTAFVLITTETGKEKDVLERLKAIDAVDEAWTVYGDYDIIAKIKTDNMDHLNELILTKLRGVSNVSMTTTLIGL